MTSLTADKSITIHIPGPPVPKKLTIGWVGGMPRILTCKESVEFQDSVKYFARVAMGERPLFGCPLFIKIFFNFPIPESKSKSWKKLALLGKLFPTSKPDIDNCQKSTLDGLTNAVWMDDCQVTDLYARKRYSDLPHTTIIITPLEEFCSQDKPSALKISDPDQGKLEI